MKLIILIVLGIAALISWMIRRSYLRRIKKERSFGKLFEFYAEEEEVLSGEDTSCEFRRFPDYSQCEMILDGDDIIANEYPTPTLTLVHAMVVPGAYHDFAEQILADPTAWGEGISMRESEIENSKDVYIDITIAIDVDYGDGNPQDYIRGHVNFLKDVQRNLQFALVKYRRELDAMDTKPQ